MTAPSASMSNQECRAKPFIRLDEIKLREQAECATVYHIQERQKDVGPVGDGYEPQPNKHKHRGGKYLLIRPVVGLAILKTN